MDIEQWGRENEPERYRSDDLPDDRSLKRRRRRIQYEDPDVMEQPVEFEQMPMAMHEVGPIADIDESMSLEKKRRRDQLAVDLVQQQFGEMSMKRQKQTMERCYTVLQSEFPEVWAQVVGRGGRDPHPLVLREYIEREFPHIEIEQRGETDCKQLLSVLFLMRHGLFSN